MVKWRLFNLLKSLSVRCISGSRLILTRLSNLAVILTPKYVALSTARLSIILSCHYVQSMFFF